MEQKKIVVKIDADLEELVPEYLENREEDVKSISELLEKDDFEKARIIGHSMKGSGGGYGFDRISEIGKIIEDSSKEKNGNEIKKAVEELSQYLRNVEVIYEE
tara:strand:+ start:138 stop:446 length:309 start_codon:yes stop_codon:yes gene_type:complete